MISSMLLYPVLTASSFVSASLWLLVLPNTQIRFYCPGLRDKQMNGNQFEENQGLRDKQMNGN